MAKKWISLLLAVILMLGLCACGKEEVAKVQTEAPATTAAPETVAATESAEVTITDMIGREVTIVPGSYKRVVCIGAGALRMYSYIGDAQLLAGVDVVGQIFGDISVKHRAEDVILEIPSVHSATKLVCNRPYRTVQLITFLFFLCINHGVSAPFHRV